MDIWIMYCRHEFIILIINYLQNLNPVLRTENFSKENLLQ